MEEDDRLARETFRYILESDFYENEGYNPSTADLSIHMVVWDKLCERWDRRDAIMDNIHYTTPMVIDGKTTYERQKEELERRHRK